MKANLSKLLTVFVVAVICLAGFAISSYKIKNDERETLYEFNEDSFAVTEAQSEVSTVVVYIAGEVVKPDVYNISSDARLKDLIEEAGGFTQNADIESLNLAQHLKDGEKIVVGNINDKVDKNEDLAQNINDENTQADDTRLVVNINTADETELQKLDGIGEKLARNIIAYREKYGDYTSIEEIREADGIGEATFDKIKGNITIY